MIKHPRDCTTEDLQRSVARYLNRNRGVKIPSHVLFIMEAIETELKRRGEHIK